MGSIGRFTSLFSLLRGVFPLFSPTLAVTALSDKSAAILLTHCAAGRGAKTTGARLGREGLPFKKRRRQAIFLFNRGEIYAVVLFVLSRACVCEEREKSERVSDVVVFAPRKQERVREPEQQQRASNRGDLEKSDGEKCLFFSSSVSLALSLQTALSSLALDEPQELGDFRSRSLSLSLSLQKQRWSASTTGRSSWPGRGASSPRRCTRTLQNQHRHRRRRHRLKRRGGSPASRAASSSTITRKASSRSA